MGLLIRAGIIRKSTVREREETNMANKKEEISFTEAEAALMLSTLVAFSDDNPSESEGVVLRKYYRHETAESAQNKLEEAGYLYPNDLNDLIPTILEDLKNSDEGFQLRTIAVALLLAEADGSIDGNEIAMLNTFAGELGISLADARIYADTSLKEIDETGKYHVTEAAPEVRETLDLSVAEATVLLAGIISFADDDPSDAEAAVIREHFSETIVASALKKMEEAGYRYPDDLAATAPSISATLDQFNRANQLKALAVAYQTASADGTVDREETKLINDLCERYLIGPAEVKQYFSANPQVR